MQRVESNQLYFLYDPFSDSDENVKREVLIPAFIIPQNVSHSYSANFSENSVLGRLSPIFMYTGGSARKLSFSIQLTEDVINQSKSNNRKDYINLVELVEDIKSLSYPKNRRDTNSVVELPPVYFQLGELSGYGIVETSIEWKKPFRAQSSNYGLVSIGFSITIENMLKPVKYMQVVEDRSEGENLIYTDKMLTEYSRKEIAEMAESLYINGYDISINDFVVPYDGSEFSAEIINILSQDYNYLEKRLTAVFGAFDRGASSNVSQDLEFIKDIGKVIFDLRGKPKKISEEIKKSKEKVREALDEYYDESKTMTKDQYYKVLDEIFLAFEKMEILAGEIYKYGASN